MDEIFLLPGSFCRSFVKNSTKMTGCFYHYLINKKSNVFFSLIYFM